MEHFTKLLLLKAYLLSLCAFAYAQENSTAIQGRGCFIPEVIRGDWFSWENGRNTRTVIDAETMSDRGRCTNVERHSRSHYRFIFQRSSCYHCVVLVVRTLNILEKKEQPCMNLRPDQEATFENVCKGIRSDQQYITLFSENYKPVNCRSALEGVWQFAYQNRFRFTGECNNPNAQIRSCQSAGSQFLITNQKFNITYKKCDNMKGTFDGVVEYSCLGDWFVGKDHFFAVANTKESRKDEKYRCFLRNREDDAYVGVSITAECNTLKTVEKSPERLRITPVKSEFVIPGCRLPQNMSGDWVNVANYEADVFINETHIIETWRPDEGRYRKTIYVCQEQRDTRIMMARLAVDGCQKDYVCFEFIPRHHDVIRYRRGLPTIKDDFYTVCSWVQFVPKYRKDLNEIKWHYEYFVAKYPVAVRCPVAGKFMFNQRGEIPFETRILGGVTLSPRPNTYCKKNISDFSVCDPDQKEIAIDETYCLSVDHLGRPVDIYSDPDYKMKCVGYWKENLKSYLITYDELDPYSKYRCWVYQRAELNRVLMSQATGPICSIRQTVQSYSHEEGAAVAIDMTEYERERDQCPMYFNDGSNPWVHSESHIKVFRFGQSTAVTHSPVIGLLILIISSLFYA